MKFIVYYTKTTPIISDKEKMRTEQLRFQDLMREQLLERVYMADDKQSIWLIFDVENREILEELIETLPLCSKLNPEISPLLE